MHTFTFTHIRAVHLTQSIWSYNETVGQFIIWYFKNDKPTFDNYSQTTLIKIKTRPAGAICGFDGTMWKSVVWRVNKHPKILGATRLYSKQAMLRIKFSAGCYFSNYNDSFIFWSNWTNKISYIFISNLFYQYQKDHLDRSNRWSKMIEWKSTHLFYLSIKPTTCTTLPKWI